MFEGYFRLGGNEVVNAERVYEYVQRNLPNFPLKSCVETEGRLHVALGDTPYYSPLQDDAPWFDENDAASGGFMGFYPLELSGTVDDTREASVTQGINDGGTVGSMRWATRAMRYRGLLIAKDDLSLHYGMTWLKAVLAPSPCGEHGGTCTGATACLFAAMPDTQPCYDADYSAGYTVPLGSITPATPFSLRLNNDAIQRGSYRIPETDGAVLRWGVSDYDGPRVRESYGPIISRRTNALTNPSFTVDTAGWLTGGRVLTRVAAGGVDGGPFGRTSGAGAGSIRTPDVDAQFGPVTASFSLANLTAPVTVSIVTVPDNVTIGTMVINPAAGWQRYFLHSAYGRKLYLAFESSGNFDIDQGQVEAGVLELGYFDGSSVVVDPLGNGELAGGEYSTMWESAPNASKSIMRWVGPPGFFGQLPEAGEQMLNFGEQCDEFATWLEVDSGTIASGMLDISMRLRIDTERQIVPFERNFHDVTVVSGPAVIQKIKAQQGVAYEVDFTFVAGTPFAYGETVDLITRQRMSALPTEPFVDVACPVEDLSPILDPDCPPLPSPPRPPTVPNLCIANPEEWERYTLEIPAYRVSAWSQMLPTIVLNTPPTTDVRQVRVRFTPNPFGFDPSLLDPCAFCSEFILSYLPADAELTVDGLTQKAFASVSGSGDRPASQLLYGTDGSPMTWPELSCGIDYVMTVDVPPIDLTNVYVSLALTKME